MRSYIITLLKKAHSVFQYRNATKMPENKEAIRLHDLWKTPSAGFLPHDTDNMLIPPEKVKPTTTIKMVVDVVIPIYNGLPHLQKLLPTLFAHTTQPHRFIFVDDCSSDKAVESFILSQIRNRENCLFLKNKQNLGFPRTVNYGVTYVTSPYFVILNTDVLVPPYWLERLIEPFEHDPKVCTTTPFTNGGAFFSFPNYPLDYSMDNLDDFLKWDRLFHRLKVVDKHKLEFINGVGFCMGIRKECWDNYGNFDADTFGKGYGEESDLCLRFTHNGWKNVLVPNLFVYHNHGGSFSSNEKKTLTIQHSKILEQKWGEYIKLIPKFIECDPWGIYRLAVIRELNKKNADCIFIDLDDTNGGACKFRMQQENRLLEENKCVVSMLYSRDPVTQWSLTFVNKCGRASFRLKDWAQVEEWIIALNPKELKVNNLAFCNDYWKVLDFLTGKRTATPIAYNSEAKPSFIITSQTPIEANVDIRLEGLSDMSFVFATYCRINDSHLTLTCYNENNKLIYSYIIKTNQLTDNGYHNIPINIDKKSGQRIRKIRLESEDSTQTNGVSIYMQKDAPCLSYSYKEASSFISANSTKLWYCFHDFLSCCPSFFLLDTDDSFCNFKDCSGCLPHNHNRMFFCDNIITWRQKWETFLQNCTELRFFSENTFHLVSRIYSLPQEKIVIKAHDSLVNFKEKYIAPGNDCCLNIAVVGAWSETKGSKQIIELASILEERDPEARILFYGVQYNKTEENRLRREQKNIIWKGEYKIEDLPSLFNKDHVSVVFFSSIWPETFSFVTKECIDMGIPVVSFDIGAPGDRVHKYEQGYIADNFSAMSVYEQVLKARQKQLERA